MCLLLQLFLLFECFHLLQQNKLLLVFLLLGFLGVPHLVLEVEVGAAVLALAGIVVVLVTLVLLVVLHIFLEDARVDHASNLPVPTRILFLLLHILHDPAGREEGGRHDFGFIGILLLLQFDLLDVALEPLGP